MVLVGVRDGGPPAREAELVENVADVAGDGLFADAQLIGDGAIRLAGDQTPKHLQFARAQPAD